MNLQDDVTGRQQTRLAPIRDRGLGLTARRCLSLGTIFLLASAGVMASSLLAGRNPIAPGQLISVQIFTDRLQPMQGAVARLENENQHAVLVTNVHGQTPWTEMRFTDGVELTLLEKVQPGGIALGMLERPVEPPEGDWETLATELFEISRTQPFAVPVAVSGSQNETVNVLPPEGDHPHWTVVVPQDSSLRFGMHVASLLDHEAILHYLTYRGHVPDPVLGYVRGVAMVMPTVQLGTPGFVMVFDLLGDLDEGVVVDAYNFSAPPHALPAGPDLAIELLGIQDDHVAVRVSGAVRGGQLALLARPLSAPPSQVFIFEDGAPQIVIPPAGGQGVQYVLAPISNEQVPLEGRHKATATSVPGSSIPIVADCEPTPFDPPPGWSCSPPSAPSNSCGAPLAQGGTTCNIATSKSPIWCRGPGETNQKQEAKGTKWKVTFRLSGEVPHGARKLTSGGGFEYGQESTIIQTDTWTAGDGDHGLGQCIMYYRQELVCVAASRMLGGRWIWSDGIPWYDPCTTIYYVNTMCTKSLHGSATCSRTP